jgi:molybdopterin-containing oxidoreductase family membrane subunit
VGFGIGAALLLLFLAALTMLLVRGVGIWGINIPVGWGFDIVNFVWWIGIGHAGTLISAILLLLRQQWRTSINRFAEAMTLFAVACGGIYPLLHMGRPWFFYWLMRYTNTMGVWPQFRTPLVVSVHTIVSLDFAVSVLPGWHTTIFPPYFVAGALFGGFAMVLTIAIPLRAAYGLQDFITLRHLQNMAKILLAAGLVVAYGYLMEAFTAWYGGSLYEGYMLRNRVLGPYGPLYALLLVCNVAVPQLLWLRSVRSNVLALFAISLVVSVGMWLERFIIVVTSLHRDFLPSAWANYTPTFWDWATFIGTIGLFITLLFLFIRFLPIISIFEMRGLISETNETEAEPGHAASPAAVRPTGRI